MEDTDSKINGDIIDADLWNQAPKELVNLIESTGQSLSAADLTQVAKSIAIYVANSNFYSDSGVANAYILATIGGKIPIQAYIDGAEIGFIPANSNLGPSVVDVNGIGSVSLVDSSGSALSGGEIQADDFVSAIFDLAFNRFRLTLSNASLTNQGITSYSSSTSSVSELEAATPLAVSTAKAEAISEATDVPSGTIMLFGQAVAPLGWTKLTRADDTAVRIVTGGTGGVQGGNLGFATLFNTSTITSPTTLTIAQIPAHTHDVTTASGPGIFIGNGGFVSPNQTPTSSTGGGGSHTHGTNLSVFRINYIEAQKD